MRENDPAGISFRTSDVCPASLIQRQFWVLHSVAPTSPAYNVPMVSVIEGDLNVAALESALNAVLQHHRVFRATFDVDAAGMLVQRFASWHRIPLPQVDLRPAQGGVAEESVAEQAVHEEIQRPFALASGPLLRFRLFRTGERSYILAITVHHIVFDLVTKDLFGNELAREYSAALLNKAGVEFTEAADYAAFSVWQERWMRSDECKKMETAWQNYLREAEPLLDLPGKRPAAAGPLRPGTIVPIRLNQEVLEQVKAFCRQAETAPFVVLLTAWALTLARWSGQKKLCVGVPLTNRRKNEFKQTMGCFVNILPLSLDISDNPTLREALSRVRKSMLYLHRMQEMPYYHLVQLMRHAGTAGGNPLFQVGFTFEHPMRLQLEGVSVTPKYIHHGGAQLDLFATFWEEAGEMAGVIEYDSGRFDSSEVKRLGEKLLVTVTEICTGTERAGDMDAPALSRNRKSIQNSASDADQRPSDRPILSAEERHQLIVEWNDTKADYPANACIHQLFEMHASQTPEAVAVEFEGLRLTYRELDARSSLFAEHLNGLGVGPDVLVALYVDRSPEMVIALLGILKAGGAYLPLDRIFPRDRLAFMLEDAKPPVVVTREKLLGELPPHQAIVVCVDAFTQTTAPGTAVVHSTSGNLAYVLYTSGSTGKPKGVEISHRAVVNFLCSMRKEPGLSADDTLLSVTTISFDILGLELWLPLTTGATVVLVPQEVVMDGKQLARAMAACKVTVMQATPATWRLLLESGWEGSPGLKVLCGGEAWPKELAGRLLSRCASLWNMYGPTETTIWSAVSQVRTGEPVVLGRPIANTQFYVVDQQLQVLPTGAPGELLIGGDGLARGYLNRPELTAEKFIPDPFSRTPGSRLYRTGDTVRYLPDGTLEYIGRLDQQVKIRGFRIELGDIESVLSAHAGVKQAVVMAYEDEGEKRLAAYIVSPGASKQPIVELRAYLRQTLPYYMIPETFLFLPELPLTPNGKVDRKALPLPEGTRPAATAAAPRKGLDARIIEWNKTDRAYPLDKCLHSFIEAQVIQTPDAPAVTYEGKTLSYHDLNKRANQLAHFLIEKGVGPEILVGVCMFRSLEMVVALWAVLKAGGAYVPFDPTYPAKRLAFMINDSKVPVILAQKQCSSLIENGTSRTICLEDIAGELERYPTINPPCTASPDNLAYVIYTSGSMGNPKGAMNTHKGIVNRLLWMQETLPIDASDTLVQKTPFSFDVSVWELFWPFMAGARLVMAKPEGHKDAQYLLNLIRREKLTIIHFVPSMLRLFLDAADQASCASLRHVVLSGEAVTIDLQKRYFAGLQAPLHNLYGPTEAAVDVSYWKCDPELHPTCVPIGRPISNTKLYILDEQGQSMLVGERGELHIGGVQVARGYLNRPELTAEKFIHDPFSDDPSARLYKTGDLCRYLPDGAIEYLGRIDFQVKIRGNRVELGEIEAALLRDPSVKDCVVIVREDTPDEKNLVAYVVENKGRFSASALRNKLAAELPDYMVPSVFVLMAALPLSPSGKTDRRALPELDRKRPELASTYMAPRGAVERLVVKIWQDLLTVEVVGLDDNFFDLGGHSFLLVRLAALLQDAFRKDISVMDLFQHPTVRKQAAFFGREESGATVHQDGQAQTLRQGLPGRQRAFSRRAEGSLKPGAAEVPEGIAVIGMDCRFPGAASVDSFWENLRKGVESIRQFTEEELIAMGVPPEIYNAPNYVRAAPLLDNIDMFDAAFFGYSPREAELIDPQQRLFLECASNALEYAGYDPGSYQGAIGVFGGAGPNYYGGGFAEKSGNSNVVERYQWELGNENDYLATRVAYKLGLKGPSMTIQTACSTSLVAAHMACQSLWTYQCDMVLAGGVGVNARIKGGYFYQENMILSPDGHCRAFDSKSQGTVHGQGVGIVVLKRLSDAVADGDRIYAVIRGSAINNDGASRVGFTAPSVAGQSEVIATAQSLAGIAPEDISYVETHGTGTPLGDPIEIKALTTAFRLSTDKRGFCPIGSVKTNVGHLDAAAGVAGLIKTVLMLEHRELPPSLHFENPNPNLDLNNSPFIVNTQLRPWQSNGTPRCAGVSSFGLGGTNAHMVLEEAPPQEVSGPSRPRQLLLFSARTENALNNAIARMASHLERDPDVDLADVAFTLQVGRRPFAYRGTVVCSDRDDAIAALRSTGPKRVIVSMHDTGQRDVVFMFSGQGSQYATMGLDLYREEPVFREQIDYCSDILQREMSIDLRRLLFPAHDKIEEAQERLTQTSITQPALFATEYALARLWMSWGIRPQALVGHSIGEYTAACLAGVFSVEDALKLVAIRGRLMQEMPPGSMLAVFLPEDKLAPFMNDEVSLSVINSPSLCVVSGEVSVIDALERDLAKEQVRSRRLRTSHAFHSKMMDPVLAPFAEEVRKIGPKPPQIPFLSNVTGTWITREEATDPNYWAKQLRDTVRFADCIQELLKEPNRVLLEVGPGSTLSTLANQHPARAKSHAIAASTRLPKKQQSDTAFILDTLCALWRAGVPIDWMAFHAGARRLRVPLPTYPFERERFWLGTETCTTDAVRPEVPRWWQGLRESPTEGKSQGANAGTQHQIHEEDLIEIWGRVLGAQTIGLDDNFFEMGGHSLMAVNIMTELEKTFGVRLPLASLIEAPTIRELVRLLKERKSGLSWKSLVPLHAQGKKAPFFLMHSHGGNILEYQTLANLLKDDRPIYALQCKGLDGSPMGEQSVEEMAIQYLKEIRTVQPKGPYFLGGYCFGGYLSLEIAHLLRAQQEEVGMLVLINSATHLFPLYKPGTTRTQRTWFRIHDRLALEWEGLRGQSLRKKWLYLITRARRMGDLAWNRAETLLDLLPENSRFRVPKHSLVYHLEQIAMANDRAWTHYRPRPYNGKVIFLRAQKQEQGIQPDPLLGWGGVLTGEVHVHEVPGFRQNMLDDPNVSEMARIILEKLP